MLLTFKYKKPQKFTLHLIPPGTRRNLARRAFSGIGQMQGECLGFGTYGQALTSKQSKKHHCSSLLGMTSVKWLDLIPVVTSNNLILITGPLSIKRVWGFFALCTDLVAEKTALCKRSHCCNLQTPVEPKTAALCFRRHHVITPGKHWLLTVNHSSSEKPFVQKEIQEPLSLLKTRLEELCVNK